MIIRISSRLSFVFVLTSLLGISGFLFLSSAAAAPPAVSSKITGSLEQLTVPPLTALQQSVPTRYPWKTNIVGTVFWVGELPTQNNPTPNTASSWDPKWMQTFGGYDNPDIKARGANYLPATFVPKLNPFYVALPYNDVLNHKTTKEEAAKVIPWFKDNFKGHGKSVCNNRWIAIKFNDRTCYAQWSDCGPFVTTDADYVFGDARPVNTKNKGAGIDLAPAVRDYLGFVSGKTCDWRFVEESEVPDGPWKHHGANNPFSPTGNKLVAAGTPVPFKPVAGSSKSTSSRSTPTVTSSGASSESANRLEELRRQRDAWFRENGGKPGAR